MKKSTVLFTDGACKGNPGKGGWGFVRVFPDGNVLESGAPEDQTTNNRMEMKAALEGLRQAGKGSWPVMVLTDSSYVINGITRWVWGWMRNGWKTSAGQDVLNKDLWQELIQESRPLEVSWQYVKGHAGIPGNERADEIASLFASGRGSELFLYKGPVQDYGVDPYSVQPESKVPQNSSRADENQKGGAKPKAWYLSYVSGELRRHKSWSDCEQVTRGRSGARYKKVKTYEEEQSVLTGWGLTDKDF